jgi:hypothetical protein
MNEKQIKELRAHAGKLVAEGRSLSGVFEYRYGNGWYLNNCEDRIPKFDNGVEWRIAKPKKQLIDWSHPYFKGCATNYGELLVRSYPQRSWLAGQGTWVLDEHLRLATPANDHTNWQPFFSTPENDAKLRELAKMVKVQVRVFNDIIDFDEPLTPHGMQATSNYRITGLQEGWTDNPEETQS